jgi:hypothetical protein
MEGESKSFTWIRIGNMSLEEEKYTINCEYLQGKSYPILK